MRGAIGQQRGCLLYTSETKYERFTETHLQRAHSEREIRAALADAGFERAEAYEAFTRNPPRDESERLQFMAWKGI